MIAPVTHEDIAASQAAQSERLAVIEDQLTKIADSLKALPKMQEDIAATKEIVEAWSAVKTVGKFLKWAGGAIAGLLAILAILKASARGLL